MLPSPRPCLVVLLSCIVVFAQTQQPPSASPSVRRVKVTPDVAKKLLIRTVPVSYPDAARKAKIEGDVAIDVIVGVSGDVQDVSAVSGDAVLVQAASEAVKQWKYKPYTVDGAPAEMETVVSFHFTLNPTTHSARPAEPPLGHFDQGTYSNAYFGISYSLSSDWVRETEVMRKRFAAEVPQGASVLLAAIYVPHHADAVDSSFTMLAVNAGGASCRQYLDSVGSSFASTKGQASLPINELPIAGRDFYRLDLEPREGPRYRSLLCSQSPDYLLIWNGAGATKKAIEIAVATLISMSALPAGAGTAATEPAKPSATANPAQDLQAGSDLSQPMASQKVKISQGVSVGLLIKRVQPSYPMAARNAHIQGTVILQAEISKAGDVIDLEAIAGPMELIASAVDAVRQWKYRPYMLLGEPIAVQTQITVNYTLSR